MKSLSLLLLLNLFFSGQIQGSTEMIQMFLPTGKESPISLPIEKLPENSTVLWLDHLNRTIAIRQSDGETKVEPPFEGKVKISGPTSLMFLSPQKSDSGFYFVKVIRDQIQTIKFNITFQDQNTDTTDASPVSPAVSAVSSTVAAVSPTVSAVSSTVAAVSPTVSAVSSTVAAVSPTVAAVSPTVAAVLAVLVLAIIAAVAAVVLWHYQKKRKLLCFARDQKGAVHFSANSGTNSPAGQSLLQPSQVNGDPHIKENTRDSPV